MELLFSLKSTTTQYQRGVSALLVVMLSNSSALRYMRRDMLSVFSGVATVCIPPPPIRKMSRFLLMKLVAYLDQTAASRDWFSS